MKKHVVLTCTFLIFFLAGEAQKYALIDATLSSPVRYANTITAREIQQKILPIERQYLPDFLNALEKIKRQLSEGKTSEQLTRYEFGCTQINGLAVAAGKEHRFNYVITSHCEKLRFSFLLCDVKFKNSTNSFIVSAWIKYLKASLRKK